MTDLATLDPYATLIEPATLKIERLLPAPAARVWDYLIQSDLRRRWLASGDMPLKAGGQVELVWRNDELTDPPGRRPDGFGDEHRMDSTVLVLEAPRHLVITWGTQSEVSFELEPRGAETLLTIIHRRAPDRGALLSVSAGWHAHLDVLAARLAGTETRPHWDHWAALKAEYEVRFPG